jgi:pilus assembly protein CpaE
MPNKTLTVSLLSGSADFSSQLGAVLKALPRVQVLSQTSQPEELLHQTQKVQPDLVIVNLENGALPGWLGDLGQGLPQTAVMVCSPNRDPDFLIRVIQLGVREFVPMPLVRADLEAALERVWAAKKRHRRVPEPDQKGRILAVTGLKGGLGTTAVAVNLAVTLTEKYPGEVVLVDLGRPFPDVAKYLDQAQQNSLLTLAENADHLDADFVLKALCSHSSGLMVLQGCPNFLQWQALDPQVLKKVWAVLRSRFAWTIIDLSHWLDGFYLQTVKEADQVLLLADLQIPNVKNLKTLWEILQSQGLTREKVKIVVNRYHKMNGADLALEGLERLQQQPVFFTLPEDHQALSEAINHGVPLHDLAPRSKLCRSLRQLTETLVAACQPESTEKEQPKARRRFLFF